MKKKLLGFFSGLEIAVLLITLLFAVGTIAFVIVGYFVSGFSALSYIYLLFSEVIIPIEFLINGTLGQFLTSNFNIIVIVAGVVVTILCALAIKSTLATRAKNRIGKYSKNKWTIIYSLLLCAYFIFNFVILMLNFSSANNFISKNISGIAEALSNSLGEQFILFKALTVSGLVAGFSFIFAFIVLLCREKKEKTKIVEGNINFYTDDYLKAETKVGEPKNKEKIKNDEVQKTSVKRVKKASQDLITRIIQLNELKDSGKITEVEYTKLRQKAIRRYKG